MRDAVLLLFLKKVCRREIRLAEGESLFSSMSISRKLSATAEVSHLIKLQHSCCYLCLSLCLERGA